MYYTLQITLKQWKPLSERTIQIDSTQTFAELARVICELYALGAEHLREFTQKNVLCINHPEIDISELQKIDRTSPEIKEILDDMQQYSGSTYRLEAYFADHQEIVFSYDFGTPRTFAIQKIGTALTQLAHPVVLLHGTGTYLVEDAGGPKGLKEYTEEYKAHKRDEDRRESREEFEAWIAPAMTKFSLSHHPSLVA